MKVASSGLRKARLSPLGERGSVTAMLLDGVDGGIILKDMGLLWMDVDCFSR